MSSLNDELERFAQRGDFDAAWATASGPSQLPRLALAAAVLLVVGLAAVQVAGPQLFAPALAPMRTDAPSTELEHHLAVNQAILIELPAMPSTVTVIQPDLVTVRALPDRGFSVQGKAVGRTDVVFAFEDRPSIMHTVTVSETPDAYTASWWMPPNGLGIIPGGAKSIDVVDPQIVSFRAGPGGEIIAIGGKPGRTDAVFVRPAGTPEVLSFDVDYDAVHPDAFSMPLMLEQTWPIQIRATNVIVGDPDMVQVDIQPGVLELTGQALGTTELMVFGERGLKRVYTVTVMR